MDGALCQYMTPPPPLNLRNPWFRSSPRRRPFPPPVSSDSSEIGDISQNRSEQTSCRPPTSRCSHFWPFFFIFRNSYMHAVRKDVKVQMCVCVSCFCKQIHKCMSTHHMRSCTVPNTHTQSPACIRSLAELIWSVADGANKQEPCCLD